VNAAAVVARPAAKALVNALLRRYLREREVLHAAVRHDPVARWSPSRSTSSTTRARRRSRSSTTR
jgi:hypothetical protein